MIYHHFMLTVTTLCVVVSTGSTSYAQNPATADSRLNQGIEAFAEERYPDAIRLFNDAIRADTELASAHYYLGLTNIQLAMKTSKAKQREMYAQRAKESLRRCIEVDPNLIIAQLELGRANEILELHETAEAELNSYIESRPDDPIPHLMLGLAYYRQARDDASKKPMAIAHFENARAALARSGEQDRTMHAFIKLYQTLLSNDLDAAQKKLRLQEIEEGNPGTALARRARVERRRLDEEVGSEGRRRWDLSLRFGVDWDSNVVLRGRRTTLSTGKDDEDWRFGTASDFTYRLVQDQKWLVGAGVTTFNSWHTDIDEFNVQDYGANIYASYAPDSLPWLALGLRYDVDNALLGNDSFLVRHRATAQADIQEGEKARTTVFYQFEFRDYRTAVVDARLDRDGITNAVGVVQRVDIVDLYDRPVTMDFSYRFESVGSDGTEFDAQNHVFRLGVSVPLPSDMTFGFSSDWELQKYRNPSLFDLDASKRRDLIHTMVFSLNKRFTEQLSARLQMVVTKDDSNVRDLGGQEFFSYDRVVYGFSLNYQF